MINNRQKSNFWKESEKQRDILLPLEKLNNRVHIEARICQIGWWSNFENFRRTIRRQNKLRAKIWKLTYQNKTERRKVVCSWK